jgi:integrase
VESALIKLGTGKSTLENYQYSGFRPLWRFFEKNGCVYYSQKLANKFAENTLNSYKNNLISVSRYRRIRKVVAMLDEYSKTGSIKWRHLPMYGVPSLTCRNFENILTQYLEDISSKKGYALSTTNRHRWTVKHFLLYLEGLGHRSMTRLTQKIVSAYIPVVAKKQASDISNVICTLKTFLTFLHKNKHIDSELVSALPRHPAKRNKHFTGFTQAEANALIDAVPSDTHQGKRNIAIFMLAENTGLRALDIAKLKLRDINWRNKTISIIQHKTRRPLILPFENRVGDALAEYILHARPESDSPFIFLTLRQPIRPVTTDTLNSALLKYVKRLNAENNSSLPKGFHCFRRGIGTWLLEAELPLTMISEILGHAHVDSAKPYLSTDLDGLRECAIGLEGIEIRAGVFQ